MINLMPPELKTGYVYARRNVVLRKWVILFLIAFIGLGALGTFGLLTIQQSTISYNNKIAASESTLQREHSAETKKQVQDVSNNFKLVIKVLSQEVLFSQMIKQVAATIPDKANLTGLTITQAQGAVDISANAIDYNTATQVQVNLSDPGNKIFSRADIVNITCNSSNTQQGKSLYPCSVNIRAQFAPDNPFLFINSQEAKP